MEDYIFDITCDNISNIFSEKTGQNKHAQRTRSAARVSVAKCPIKKLQELSTQTTDTICN